MLTCTRCKKEKPGTAQFFPLHNKKRNGLDSWCRECRAAYRSEICRGRHRNVISDVALKDLKATVTECVICGDSSPLVVDHDHVTGQIRGVLCNHCNRGLGHFRDDPQLLEFARMYLLASVDDFRWESYYKKTASDPNSRINKSLRAWKC
jgi:hypothetical protein